MENKSNRLLRFLAMIGILSFGAEKIYGGDLNGFRQSLRDAIYSTSSIGTYELSDSHFLSGPCLLGYKAKAASRLSTASDRNVLEAILAAFKGHIKSVEPREGKWGNHGFRIWVKDNSSEEITILISFDRAEAEVRGLGDDVLRVGFDSSIQELLRENTGIRFRDIKPVIESKD